MSHEVSNQKGRAAYAGGAIRLLSKLHWAQIKVWKSQQENYCKHGNCYALIFIAFIRSSATFSKRSLELYGVY